MNTNIAVLNNISSRINAKQEGVNVDVTTLVPDGLEHSPTGLFFKLSLKVVSYMAKKSNLYKANGIIAGHKGPKKPTLKNVLWDMGRDPRHYSSSFVDGYSKLNHDAKVYAAGWRSLEIFYNFRTKYAPTLNASIGDVMTKFWIGGMQNRQAVANRKDIVVGILVERIRYYARSSDEVRLVSLASGSAQAVVEAIVESGVNVKFKLIDSDSTALEASREMVAKAGLSDSCEIIKSRIDMRTIRRHSSSFEPHIIEMVGLMDYLTDSWAIGVTREIKTCLVKGGCFLTCNINYNSEKEFLDWVLLWPMIYRTPKEWGSLLVKGWLGDTVVGNVNNIQLIYDPFNIHGIAKCIK